MSDIIALQERFQALATKVGELEGELAGVKRDREAARHALLRAEGEARRQDKLAAKRDEKQAARALHEAQAAERRRAKIEAEYEADRELMADEYVRGLK
jgi:hypothetical protein